MPSDSGATTSFWMEAEIPVYPPLTDDVIVDVCIIGAGIAGLSTAYHLARLGQKVLVVDDGAVGGGETGRTTAHLTNAFDDRYYVVEKRHGAKISKIIAESHTAAIDRIEEIVRRERIECDFRRVDGYLFAPSNNDIDELSEELEAVHRAGIADVRRVDAAPGLKGSPNAALLFPRQGQIQPLLYLKGLADAVIRSGGRIHCGTHVINVEDGQPTLVKMQGGHTVSATATVVATNTPVNDRFFIHTKQASYRTFVVGLRVSKGSVPWNQWWDTLDPYHYVRVAGALDATHDLLIVGGEDHKTGQADDADARFDRLTAWAGERFPVLGEPVYRWSGQVMQPADGLAFIGRNPGDNHVFIVTGDSGNGMTHGTIAGMLLGDLVVGRENAWAEAYHPSRKSLHAIGEFAKENVNVVAQYAEWVTPGEATRISEIEPDEGAIVRHGFHKLAVYRDRDGTPCAFDATCPHLGCIVEWNNTEKTWDCPCHGSRFDAHGRVVNGPAIDGLTAAEVPE